MTKHIPWITVLLLFCLIVSVKRAEASGDHHEQPAQSLKSKGKNMMLPILIIGGGIACLLYCRDEKPAEPNSGTITPNLGPAVKNDMTPDQLYIFDLKQVK